MTRLLLLLLPFLLVACASKPAANASSTEAAVPTGNQVGEAITSPLRTLNLVKPDVAAPLRTAAEAPYATPQPLVCETIQTEVLALNTVLGPDLDAIASNASTSLVDRGSEAANKAAVNALRNAADGLIPYGGVVRQLTGANRAAKEAADARTAGIIRRAYLKGLGQAMKCEVPAAPLSEGRALPQPAAPAEAVAPTPTSER